MLILILALAASACGRQQVVAPPVQPVVVTDSGTPLPPDGRNDTYAAGYEVALAQARQWDAQAVLYQIPATAQMERNLGLPGSGPPGWFYMFKVPGSPVEFFVKIVDGRVSGYTEAQPIIIGEPPFTYLPIDLNAIKFTNFDVLRMFMERGGTAYVSANGDFLPDYRLLHIQGQPNMVWSLFDGTDADLLPLINVDAVTGEVVEDPYGR